MTEFDADDARDRGADLERILSGCFHVSPSPSFFSAFLSPYRHDIERSVIEI